jgi:hypothetical protein
MSDALHPLLKVALEAHGGHDRWVKFKGIASTILTGGKLWELKGAPLIPVLRRATSEFHRLPLWQTGLDDDLDARTCGDHRRRWFDYRRSRQWTRGIRSRLRREMGSR